MSEVWRRKTYYRPRVLIDTARILDPQFSDALVCITGAQLEMLRNLTQYLSRRSTFAAGYTTDYYLAPTEAQWDEIQAIVADLEETLMGCEELTAVFEAMLAQLQCICTGTAGAGSDAGSVQPIVDVGLEDGVLIENDPYGPDTEILARRCAVAQLTYWQAWEWLTEIIQPVQENAMDVVVPLTLSVIAVMVGATPLAIPAGAVIALLSVLIDVWVDGSLQDVQNSVWAHRDELTCAVLEGLSYDYRAAESRASAVIAEMTELSVIDRIVIRAMFAPWAMALASKAYTEATDWAVANVYANACDDCSWTYEVVYEFPPSPGDWTGGFPSYIGRWPGINQNEDGYSPDFELPDIGENIDIEIQTKFTSCHGYGNTCGRVWVEYQDVGLAWHIVGGATITTLEDAGDTTDRTDTDDNKAVPRNVLRMHIEGQAAQSETDPWPFMPSSIRVKIVPHT